MKASIAPQQVVTFCAYTRALRYRTLCNSLGSHYTVAVLLTAPTSFYVLICPTPDDRTTHATSLTYNQTQEMARDRIGRPYIIVANTFSRFTHTAIDTHYSPIHGNVLYTALNDQPHIKARCKYISERLTMRRAQGGALTLTCCA